MATLKTSTHRCDDFPIRGTPGGWRDRWDDPDLDTATLRLVAAAIRQHQDDAAARVRAAIRQGDE